MTTLLTTSYKLVASVKTSTYSILRLYAKYNSQNIENNTSNISLQARLYGNGGAGSFASGTIVIAGTSYSLGNTSYSKGAETTLKTKTYDVTHNDDGTLELSVSAKLTTSATPNGTATGTITLPVIPRATTPSVPALYIELGQPITISTPRASDSFTHKLYYEVGASATTLFAEDVGDSYVWENNLFLANWINDSTKKVVNIICETYLGDKLIGEDNIWFFGIVPENVIPTIDNVTITEAVNGIADKIGTYVKNKSKLNVVIEASGDYASTIKSYRTTIDNITYIASNFTSDVLTTGGILEVTISVTDSRERTATKTIEIEVLDYYAPKITGFGVYRCNSAGTLVDDDTGTYLKLYINWDIAPLNNKNDKNVVVEYREYGTENWITLLTYTDAYTNGSSTRDSISTTQFNVDKTYEVREVVSDYFQNGENSNTLTKTIDPTYTLINFHKSGTGVAFNKVATKENAVEFGEFIYDQWNTVITNGLAVYGGDPDTTLESLILTSTNSPNGEAMFFFTFFSSNKTASQNCGQIAIPYYYNGTQSIYWRYRFAGWSEWHRLTNASEIGELSDLTTNFKSSIVKAINEVDRRGKIVYETTLTTATNTIEATDLDMAGEGGEYEFELIHAETTTVDLYITFNDIDTGYFQEGIYWNNSLTANGSLNTTTFYRPNMERIYYGTGGSTTIAFPGIMKGRFKFTNASNEKVYYEFKNVVSINGQQTITELYGVNSTTVDNLTSIKFVKSGTGSFLAGTKLVIRRVN